MSPDSSAVTIDAAFHAMGLPVFSFIDRTSLQALARVAGSSAVDRYGLLASSGAVVAAFPYDPRTKDVAVASGSTVSGQEDGTPQFARIGAFAAWNRYAALSRLLLGAGRLLAAESGLPAKGFRAMVNSRLPEKHLAVLAGLGFIGRSSLVVTDAYGPACLLGALLLPPDFPVPGNCRPSSPAVGAASLEAALAPGSGCGSCADCANACPGRAISSDGAALRLERCIQYWTTRPGDVPERIQAVWGRRLYGCDDCVAACPRSRGAWTKDAAGTSPAERAEGLFLPVEQKPGNLVPVSFLENAGDDEIKAFFRKTALGLSWIGAGELRRNACLSKPRPNVGI